MRKSPRLLAAFVVLGLFAFVGTLTAGAFMPSTTNSTAPQGTSNVRAEKVWEETARTGSVTKP